MTDHPILSEKPEDMQKAVQWAKEQAEKRKINDEVGKELWKRIFPVIKRAAEAQAS